MVDGDAVTVAARVRERRLALGWDTNRLALESALPVDVIEAIEAGHGRSLDVSLVASAIGSTLGWLRSTPPEATVAWRPLLTPEADAAIRARYRLDQAVEELALDAAELVEAGVVRPAGSSRPDGTRALDVVRAAIAGLDDPSVIDVAAALGLHVNVRPDVVGAGGLRIAPGIGVAIIGGGEGTLQRMGDLLAWWLGGDSDYLVHDDTTAHNERADLLDELPPGDPAAYWVRLYDVVADRPRAAYRRLQTALRNVGEDR